MNRPRRFGVTELIVLYGFLTASLIAPSLIITPSHQFSIPPNALFLSLAAGLLAQALVRLERGLLNLSAIATQAAGILLLPIHACIVGAAALLISSWQRRRPAPIGQIVASAFWTTLGSATHQALLVHGVNSNVAATGAILANGLGNFVCTALVLSALSGEGVLPICQRNVTPLFIAAFGYFALAAFLLSNILDGSIKGYVLGSLVCLLALALADTVGGRRLRSALEAQLTDAERHLAFSRAVEGVVHNLRNHIALIKGQLEDVDLDSISLPSREYIESALAGSIDAADAMNRLASSANPRLGRRFQLIDLHDSCIQALALVRVHTRREAVHLRFEESPDTLRVLGDSLLLREVLTNLLLNAAVAANHPKKVTVSCGRRPDGRPYVSVADNGPGVPPEHRGRLFEPHFTTKPNGSGMGLFMSYGIIREHRGELLYEGSRKGAVFTVVLPPAGPGPNPSARPGRLA